MKSSGWFEVDKDGLARILKRRGMQFILYELVQNAWDTDAQRVSVEIHPVPGQPLVELTAADDSPEGFKDLSHAYRLFAESEKKADPRKRGRFNLGEKLVLAVCKEARIISTKGSVYFETDAGGFVRRHTKECLPAGSRFEAKLRMTRGELDEVLSAVDDLLPPKETCINGRILPTRIPLRTFEVTLPTEVADEEGYLRRSARKTEVRVYEPFGGKSQVYEMGIPVVPIDFPWTLEVMQKIPLNTERDNLTPAYFRELSVQALNAMKDSISVDTATVASVQEAMSHEGVLPEVVSAVLTHQYGEKRAILDPSDREANHRLVAEGYTLIPGNAFSKGAWDNIRKSEAALPAGKISPSYNPYSKDPNAPLAQFVPREEWTPGMQNMASYAEALGRELLGRTIHVRFESNRMTSPWVANYGDGELTFNYARLGKRWFGQGPNVEVNDLLLHEFGHEFSSNHLDEKFYAALTKLGAKLWALAMENPGFFKPYSVPSV